MDFRFIGFKAMKLIFNGEICVGVLILLSDSCLQGGPEEEGRKKVPETGADVDRGAGLNPPRCEGVGEIGHRCWLQIFARTEQ